MKKILCGVLLCGSLAFCNDDLKSYTLYSGGYIERKDQNINQDICEISTYILNYKNYEKKLLSILKSYATEQELQTSQLVDIKKKYYKSMKEKDKINVDSFLENMDINSVEICRMWQDLTPKDRSFVANLKYDIWNTNTDAISEADVKLNHCNVANQKHTQNYEKALSRKRQVQDFYTKNCNNKDENINVCGFLRNFMPFADVMWLNYSLEWLTDKEKNEKKSDELYEQEKNNYYFNIAMTYAYRISLTDKLLESLKKLPNYMWLDDDSTLEKLGFFNGKSEDEWLKTDRKAYYYIPCLKQAKTDETIRECWKNAPKDQE